MGDVLRRTGENFLLIVPDDAGDDTLNGSSPGADGISLAGFEAALWENGEPVAATIAALVAAPFFLTVDNVSQTDLAMYKVNLTLPNRSFYELWIRHPTAMVAFRQEQFDLRTRAEVLAQIRGNSRVDFTIAVAQVPARNVAVGVVDTMRVRHRFDGATTFDPVDLVSDVTVQFHYAVMGHTNPSSVRPA